MMIWCSRNIYYY